MTRNQRSIQRSNNKVAAKVTSRCKKCNHHIWRAESIAAGIGPVCARKGFDEEVSKDLQSEIRRLASEILNQQKYGKGKKSHSSNWLWKRNKSLLDKEKW